MQEGEDIRVFFAGLALAVLRRRINLRSQIRRLWDNLHVLRVLEATSQYRICFRTPRTHLGMLTILLAATRVGRKEEEHVME